MYGPGRRRIGIGGPSIDAVRYAHRHPTFIASYAGLPGKWLSPACPPILRLNSSSEALSQFRAEEKKVARAVIEGLILEHASQRFANIDDSR